MPPIVFLSYRSRWPCSHFRFAPIMVAPPPFRGGRKRTLDEEAVNARPRVSELVSKQSAGAPMTGAAAHYQMWSRITIENE